MTVRTYLWLQRVTDLIRTGCTRPRLHTQRRLHTRRRLRTQRRPRTRRKLRVIVENGPRAAAVHKSRVRHGGELDGEGLVTFEGRVADDGHCDRQRDNRWIEDQRPCGRRVVLSRCRRYVCSRVVDRNLAGCAARSRNRNDGLDAALANGIACAADLQAACLVGPVVDRQNREGSVEARVSEW